MHRIQVLFLLEWSATRCGYRRPLLPQACRCGGNPNKDEEAAEKAALSSLKKCVDYHGQTSKVLVARSKDLVEARAEAEPAKRLLDDLRHRKEVGVELFSKHAAPFFEWLEAEEESEDEAAEIS